MSTVRSEFSSGSPQSSTLRSKPPRCQGCPLYGADMVRPVWGCGSPKARIMLVGEAPGPDENNEGEPFVGGAGFVLNAALKATGLTRQEVWITNVVKCMPPTPGGGFREPTLCEIEACSSRWLTKELGDIKPTVVVALGAVAYHHLSRSNRPVLKQRGYVEELAK